MPLRFSFRPHEVRAKGERRANAPRLLLDDARGRMDAADPAAAAGFDGGRGGSPALAGLG